MRWSAALLWAVCYTGLGLPRFFLACGYGCPFAFAPVLTFLIDVWPRTNCRLGGQGKNRDAYPHRSRDLQKPLRL